MHVQYLLSCSFMTYSACAINKIGISVVELKLHVFTFNIYRTVFQNNLS